MSRILKTFSGENALRSGLLTSTREFNIVKYPNDRYNFDIICCGSWTEENDLTLEELIETCEYWNVGQAVIQGLKDNTLEWETIETE